jgi:hypothetical protein
MEQHTLKESKEQQLPRSVTTQCCWLCGEQASASARESGSCSSSCRRTFCGLMSRCTQPFACSTASASVTCTKVRLEAARASKDSSMLQVLIVL